LADPTVQALWNAVLLFELLPAGFSNRQLREPLAQLLGIEANTLTQGRMSYHLRRLRLHGLIQRIPKTHRYRLTSLGLRTALFCTRVYHRVLRKGIGAILSQTSPAPSPLRRSFEQVEQQINLWIEQVKMAA
jgi:DNA-binding HxlR family transcriptional regulator